MKIYNKNNNKFIIIIIKDLKIINIFIKEHYKI